MSILTNNLGGPFMGFTSKPTAKDQKDSEFSLERGILRRAWNGAQTANSINGNGRITTPFRAVNNAGDYLGRVNYKCGGSSLTNASKPGQRNLIRNMFSVCDNKNVVANYGNSKFVFDSSDYVRFKKQRAISRNYNDVTFVGDSAHGSYQKSAIAGVRH